MSTSAGNYLIGLNDGATGNTGLLSVLLSHNASYREGVEIGTSRAILAEVRGSSRALLQEVRGARDDAMETRREAREASRATNLLLLGLASLIDTGQKETNTRLDDISDLIGQQIHIERTKNALVDLEPYLVQNLIVDATWFAGKSVGVLTAEREIYLELGEGIDGMYEDIGRIVTLAPGAVAINKVVIAYDTATRLSLESGAGFRCQAGLDRALDASMNMYLAAGVDPHITGIALDFFRVVIGKEISFIKPTKTSVKMHGSLLEDCVRPIRNASIEQLYGESQRESLDDCLVKTQASVKLFGTWSKDLRTTTRLAKTLATLRAALIDFDSEFSWYERQVRDVIFRPYHEQFDDYPYSVHRMIQNTPKEGFRGALNAWYEQTGKLIVVPSDFQNTTDYRHRNWVWLTRLLQFFEEDAEENAGWGIVNTNDEFYERVTWFSQVIDEACARDCYVIGEAGAAAYLLRLMEAGPADYFTAVAEMAQARYAILLAKSEELSVAGQARLKLADEKMAYAKKADALRLAQKAKADQQERCEEELRSVLKTLGGLLCELLVPDINIQISATHFRVAFDTYAEGSNGHALMAILGRGAGRQIETFSEAYAGHSNAWLSQLIMSPGHRLSLDHNLPDKYAVSP